MDEDDFLIEAADWAGYCDRAEELIKEAVATGKVDPPPREVVDSPEAFYNWLGYCKRMCLS